MAVDLLGPARKRPVNRAFSVLEARLLPTVSPPRARRRQSAEVVVAPKAGPRPIVELAIEPKLVVKLERANIVYVEDLETRNPELAKLTSAMMSQLRGALSAAGLSVPPNWS